MEIRNKTFHFLGDSITEGYGLSDINFSYWKLLEKKWPGVRKRIWDRRNPFCHTEDSHSGAICRSKFSLPNRKHGQQRRCSRCIWRDQWFRPWRRPLRADENMIINSYGYRCAARLIDYVDAILEVAGYYSIPVLDLYRISGIQPAVPVLRAKYAPDGLHPNENGHMLIYRKLRNFLALL